MSRAVRVLLADDHALVRKGFRRLLEDSGAIAITGEASTGREALAMAGQQQPDVAVLDVTMPEMDGLEATREMKRRFPAVAVLIVSMHADPAYAQTARDAGASGYVLKSAAELDLEDAILRVARGETVFPEMAIPAASAEQTMLRELTPRERQVLQLLASGKANKEIAAQLGVSVNTVAVHRARLMDTLGIRGTAELTLFAVRSGLVSPR
ncbi:MAG: response regulator transcription factor [Bryobacterales bacterium]|nr:response regulator transcription factor [Bryobacterales bacterium]